VAKEKIDLRKGNAVVGQSGGPTAVINQSLVGVVEGLLRVSQIQKILGCRHGVRGIVGEDYIPLQKLPADRLKRIAGTPSAALGSTRDKPDAEYCGRIFESFKKQKVRYFFYIGGNDSSDTCRIINDLAQESKYELRCFHVPKTIDNDLMENDHTPGFPSAARFVAQAFMGDNLDNRALPGVKINVIMGRHAGFLTAASMLGRRSEEDGPHLVYVPEVTFDLDRFLADVQSVYKKYNRCLIAVSEGIHDQEKKPIAVKLAELSGKPVERDSHGNVQLSGSGVLGDYLADLIKQKLGIKRVRSDTFGYLQRSFAGCTSPIDAREARQVGRKAAQFLAAGHHDGSVAIRRLGDAPYRAGYERIDLSAVAARTRVLPAEYILGNNNIHDSYRDYLAPLVGNLPIIETL
jgi:6-phosphofructokinase 1